MQLVFDEEDDEEKEREKCTGRSEDPPAQTHTENDKWVDSSRGLQRSTGNPSLQDAVWDAGQ